MINRNFAVFFIIIIFFLSKNVVYTFGVDTKFLTTFDIFFGIFAIFYIHDNLLKKYSSLGYLLLFLTFFCGLKLITDRSDGIRVYVLIVFCTPILLASLPQINKYPSVWNRFYIIYNVFFVVECFVSFAERFLHHNFFIIDRGLKVNLGGTEAFRSYGLLGHPLDNAVIVSTMMTFYLISNIKYKYLFWGIGFLSLLCFEARSAIVGSLLILAVYFLCLNFRDNKNFYQKLKMNILLILCTGVGCLIAFSLGLGSRLVNRGLDDESAQVRMDIWKIFDKYDIDDFLFGLDYKTIEEIMVTMGLFATENFWIDFLFRFGLIFLCFIVFLYYRLSKEFYKNYSKFQIFLTASTFILMSSTCNSLSTNWFPLFIYLFSILLFSNYCSVKIPKILYIKLIFRILQKNTNQIELNQYFHKKHAAHY